MASPSGVSLADTERHDVESGESWRQPHNWERTPELFKYELLAPQDIATPHFLPFLRRVPELQEPYTCCLIPTHEL
jgi:hypothetical protein